MLFSHPWSYLCSFLVISEAPFIVIIQLYKHTWIKSNTNKHVIHTIAIRLIHSLIFIKRFILVRLAMYLESVPVTLVVRREHTLDGTPVYEQTHSHIQSHLGAIQSGQSSSWSMNTLLCGGLVLLRVKPSVSQHFNCPNCWELHLHKANQDSKFLQNE